MAICSGNLELVKLLDYYGANLSLKSIISIVTYIIKTSEKQILEGNLELACRLGYFHIVQYLIEKFDPKNIDFE